MNALNILVVDDDVDSAESLSILLGSWGHAVTVAHTGEGAIEQFTRQRFDITLMDVRLPGIDGTESFLRIRELDPAARVIMMTGYRVKPLIARALANGALEVFNKPLDIPRIRSLLDIAKDTAILILDDDEDFCISTRDLLAGRGYRVYVATEGEEAIELFREARVDVLVLDLNLPGLPGHDVLNKLESLGYGPPTVVVTAFGADFAEALEAIGTEDGTPVLHKPFDPASLVSAVEALAAAR